MDSDHLHDKFVNHYKRPPPIVGSVEERCLQALRHVAAGLGCLQYFQKANDDSESSKIVPEDEEIPMAKPFEPIPMPYAKINANNDVEGAAEINQKNSKKTKKRKEKSRKRMEASSSGTTSVAESPNALLLKNKAEAQPLPTWQDFNDDHVSWKHHLKILLYEKAELVYATLAEQHYVAANYGASLRNLGLLVRCHHVLSKLYHSSNTLMKDCLLGRAGDCCIMVVQTWSKVEKYQNEFNTFLEEDEKMKGQLEKDEQLYNIKYVESSMKCVLIHEIRTIEQMLLKGKYFVFLFNIIFSLH